jgi:hypothetical protein
LEIAMAQEHKPETHGGVAAAEQGMVILDGPNGVAVAMTPEAAEETAHRLEQAAAEARRQQQLAN